MQMQSNLSTRLQYQHKSLLDILDGLADEQVRRQVHPGKWSIFEQIVHLQTYQHIFFARIKKIREEDNPIFPVYKADTDPVFLDHCSKSTHEIMRDMITQRKDMSLNCLSVDEKDFVKTGTHPVLGTMNVLQWLNFFLLHEAHHLYIIFKLAAELKRS